MSHSGSSYNLHVGNKLSVNADLHSGSQNGWVYIRSGMVDAAVHCNAEAADEIAAAFALLADMIRDANQGERQRLEEVDGMCDLGAGPVPYVQPS